MLFQKSTNAFIESLFPVGEDLPAITSKKLISNFKDITNNSSLALVGISLLLIPIELRGVITCGRFFSSLSIEKRQQLLQRWSYTLITGNYLRIASIPFKLAFLLDKKTIETVKTHNGVTIPLHEEKQSWQQQISRAQDFESDEELEADVVIVGTGAGGAAAAYELSSKGLAVVLIEEGEHYQRKDFNGKVVDMISKLYRGKGATGTIGNCFIPIPLGKTVGGTTTINSGTCMRTPSDVMAEWRTEGLSEFTDETMAPYFEQVEEIISSKRADKKYVGPLGDMIAKGADAMGLIDHQPLLRNAEGCDGQGLCQFGCPTEAKKSTNVSYIPRALDSGAFLFTGMRATKLLRQGNTVEGLVAEGKGKNGDAIHLTIKTSKTILSMGTFYTPVFLKRNGIKNRWLGRNLSVHPGGVVTGYFSGQEFDNSRSIPQGYGIHDYAKKRLTFEGGTPPFIVHGISGLDYGEEFIKNTERFQNTAYFGFMLREKSRGRVWGLLGRDIPLASYSMNKSDFKLFMEGIEVLATLYLKAGADEINIPGHKKYDPIRNEAELRKFLNKPHKPRDFLLSAYHPLGTARIATDKSKGVCDPNHKVFDVDNLYVMDGSSVPSALGANPQVTIMAMASKAAEKIADQLLAEI